MKCKHDTISPCQDHLHCIIQLTEISSVKCRPHRDWSAWGHWKRQTSWTATCTFVIAQQSARPTVRHCSTCNVHHCDSAL